MKRCPVTHGGGDLGPRVACTLLQGHGGQHKGGGAVWWHGNGEGCPGCKADRHE